jgi:hypothetical protein
VSAAATVGVCRLVLTEVDQRLTNAHAELVLLARGIVALAAASGTLRPRDRNGAERELLQSLLNPDSDLPGLNRKARMFGIDVDETQTLVLLVPIADGAALLSEVRGAFAPGSVLVAGPSADGIVVILGGDGAQTSAPMGELLELVADELDGQYLVAATRSCRGAKNYPAAHREARMLIGCLRTFRAGKRRTLCHEYVGGGGLLLASADVEGAGRFAEATLGPLLESSNGMPELLATLSVFVDKARNARATRSCSECTKTRYDIEWPESQS